MPTKERAAKLRAKATAEDKFNFEHEAVIEDCKQAVKVLGEIIAAFETDTTRVVFNVGDEEFGQSFEPDKCDADGIPLKPWLKMFLKNSVASLRVE